MDSRRVSAEKRKELAPLRKKISEKETQIQKLEEAIQKLDSSLAKPGLFENDPEKGVRLSKKRAEAERLLGEVEEAWLELSSEYGLRSLKVKGTIGFSRLKNLCKNIQKLECMPFNVTLRLYKPGIQRF